MPAGRPTDYDKKYCDMIIEHMSQGLSKESFAGAIGKSKQTIYNWMEQHEEFMDAVKEGEAACLIFWEKLGMGGTAGKIGGFNATAWIFNMKNRFHQEWRDRHELTGADGGPVQTETKVLKVVGVSPDEDSDT